MTSIFVRADVEIRVTPSKVEASVGGECVYSRRVHNLGETDAAIYDAYEAVTDAISTLVRGESKVEE